MTNQMISFLLPGAMVTYMGEEINMVNTFVSWEDTVDPQGCNAGRDLYQLFSRDPQRTPFQWNSSPFAGKLQRPRQSHFIALFFSRAWVSRKSFPKIVLAPPKEQLLHVSTLCS